MSFLNTICIHRRRKILFTTLLYANFHQTITKDSRLIYARSGKSRDRKENLLPAGKNSRKIPKPLGDGNERVSGDDRYCRILIIMLSPHALATLPFICVGCVQGDPLLSTFLFVHFLLGCSLLYVVF